MITKLRKSEIKVRLDRDLAFQLRTTARSRGVALGGIIERALDSYFRELNTRKESEQNMTPSS